MPRRNKIEGWRARLKRREDQMEPRERFLIVCEGAKTEPNYFRSFPLPRVQVELVIEGRGMNTLSLVKRAIELTEAAKKEKEDFQQIWCVFDRDSFSANDFNGALQLAKNNGLNVAYSNQAFELWYLLHFNYHNTSLPRSDYSKRLTKLLKKRYTKNSKSMYSELADKQPGAIKNAEKLLNSYGNKHNPEKDDPSTTVHLLVRALNKYIE